jgi:peptide/nickel transport system substrate-binding protein
VRTFHKFLVLLVLLAVPLMLAACGPTAAPAEEEAAPAEEEAAPAEEEAAPAEEEAAPAEEEPVTFVFGAQGDAVQLDPAVVTDGESFRVVEQGCEGLLEFEPGTNNPVASLAESWENSDDFLTWTFHLRQGVTFHDGTPFNADAVVFNFERWMDTTNPYHFAEQVFEYYESMWGGFDADSNITSVEALDEYTVQFTLASPTTMLPNMAMAMFDIASPTAIEEYGVDYGTPDVGYVCTGPYEFVEWVTGDHTTLQRYPDYWGEVTGNVETIVIRPIVDPAARLAALQAGEIDGYFGATADDVAAVEGDPNFQVLRRDPLTDGYLAFNYRVMELRDPMVREAIALAINRQAISDAFYGGAGQVANQWLAPGMLGYDADALPGFAYDPDQAMQLLADAGYPDGISEVTVYSVDEEGNVVEDAATAETGPLNLYVMPVTRPYMPDAEGVAQAVAADLAAVGIQTEMVSLGDWSLYLDERRNGRLTGLYFLGWTGDNGDPDNFLGYFFAGADVPVMREGYYYNPDVAALLMQARAEPDPAVRGPLYVEAEQMLHDEAGRVWLVYNRPPILLASYVSGYAPSPTGTEFFRSVVVER